MHAPRAWRARVRVSVRGPAGGARERACRHAITGDGRCCVSLCDVAVWCACAQKLGLFPSAHAIAMGDKEYHGAVNIGATMKARYNAWQHRVSIWCSASAGVSCAAPCALRSSSL